TTAAGLGEEWAPRELRHSFVSILSAHGVRIEDISDLVGHSGTTVTETVYRHEIRPALTTGATAMDKILSDAPKKPWMHEPRHATGHASAALRSAAHQAPDGACQAAGPQAHLTQDRETRLCGGSSIGSRRSKRGTGRTRNPF